MVGNMVGTSLAMAPAFVLGQLCDVVDLDGPTFLSKDRIPGMTYVDGMRMERRRCGGGTRPRRLHDAGSGRLGSVSRAGSRSFS